MTKPSILDTFELADLRRGYRRLKGKLNSSFASQVTEYLSRWRLKPTDDASIYVAVRLALYEALKQEADQGSPGDFEINVYAILGKNSALLGEPGSAAALPRATWLRDENDRHIVERAFTVLETADRFIFFLWFTANLSVASIAAILNFFAPAKEIHSEDVERHLRRCWRLVCAATPQPSN